MFLLLDESLKESSPFLIINVHKVVYTVADEDKTHRNLRKHMQIDKTQENQENIFINLKTFSQHLENILQITQHITETTREMFPEET